MPEVPDRADPRALLKVLWRWKLVFLVVLIAAPVAAYFIENRKPRIYQSSTLVSVQNSTVDTSLLGGSGSFSTSNIAAIARLISTTPVANLAAARLHPPASPGAIAGEVSAAGDPLTNFLTITADDRSPARAAAIANAFAAAIGSDLAGHAVDEIDKAIAGVRSQLKALPRGAANAAARAQLLQQLRQLDALRNAQGNNAQVLQPATASSTPISPHERRAVELGLVIGLLLAIGAVALIENSDRRIRSPRDLEDLTRLPLLSAVPSQAFSDHGGALSERTLEAFQMLRASLTYFNVDRPLATILITSPGKDEGKTTVAVGLALAAASAGKSTVLVDADLRRSPVALRLGLAPRARGLSDVLAGTLRLPDALVDQPVDASRGGRLLVLPAGPAPPNPAQLLSSQEMQRVLNYLASHVDLVIVDTPAALAVSDLLPLLPGASGVVVIARMNRTGRESVRRLQRMIVSASGTALGVVATGMRTGLGSESYGYDYYTPRGRFWQRGARRAHRRRAAQAAAVERVALTQSRPRDGLTRSRPRDA